MKFSTNTLKAIGNLRTMLPELQRKKAELKERIRIEGRCTGTTKKNEPCKSWAVLGDAEKRCIRHGGAETAKTPRNERFPACRCKAYKFPHRHRSGFCNYPDEPLKEHPTPKGQRRYYKRVRVKKWLKSLRFGTER